MAKTVDIFKKLNFFKLIPILDYTLGTIICEFIDNSISDYEYYVQEIKKIDPKSKLKINIIYEKDKLTIQDNSHGMSSEDLMHGMVLQQKPKNQEGQNLHGLGMKLAIAWLGKKCEIKTSRLLSQEKSSVYLDIDKIAEDNQGEIEIINTKDANKMEHYTIITIWELRSNPGQKQLKSLRRHLIRTYQYKLDNPNIEIRLCQKKGQDYIGLGSIQEKDKMIEKISCLKSERPEWSKNPVTEQNYLWAWEDSIEDRDKNYDFSGYVGLCEKVDEGGVYLYFRERLIEFLTSVEAFGKGNPYRRIYVQLQCRGSSWEPRQNKQHINWTGEVKEKFLNKLQNFLKTENITTIAGKIKKSKKETNVETNITLLRKYLENLHDDESNKSKKWIDINYENQSKHMFILSEPKNTQPIQFIFKNKFLLSKIQQSKLNDKSANIISLLIYSLIKTITNLNINSDRTTLNNLIGEINNFLAKYSEIIEKKLDKKKTKQSTSITKDWISGIEYSEAEEDKNKFKFNQQIAEKKKLEIEELFKNNKFSAKVDKFCVSANVTRFIIKWDEGVKKNELMKKAIENEFGRIKPILFEDLEDSNKIAFDLENKEYSKLDLRSILKKLNFDNDTFSFLIGKNMCNELRTINLNKTRHLLIGGGTSYGKSNLLLSIITFLICTNTSKNLKLALIDPKKVEFNVFKDIPHLWKNKIMINHKDISEGLEEIVEEMEKRLNLFKKKNMITADIDKYNELVKSNKKLPKIIVLIDEATELLDKENIAPSHRSKIIGKIKILAQKSRAVGICVIIVAHRPSRDSLPPSIKTNLAGKIAFKVNYKEDSHTILSRFGAEKLVGKGDFLYSKPGGSLERIQSAFIEPENIQSIVNWLKNKK